MFEISREGLWLAKRKPVLYDVSRMHDGRSRLHFNIFDFLNQSFQRIRLPLINQLMVAVVKPPKVPQVRCISLVMGFIFVEESKCNQLYSWLVNLQFNWTFCGFQVLKMFHLIQGGFPVLTGGFLITPVCGGSPYTLLGFIWIMNKKWFLPVLVCCWMWMTVKLPQVESFSLPKTHCPAWKSTTEQRWRHTVLVIGYLRRHPETCWSLLDKRWNIFSRNQRKSSGTTMRTKSRQVFCCCCWYFVSF